MSLTSIILNMETFININKIISIKVVDKREHLREPWYYKVHEKGEHKYLITLDFLFFEWKLFKCKAVYEEDMFQFAVFDNNPRLRSQMNKSCMENDRNLFVEDGILYEKPYLEIIMENDEKFFRYMDTVEDIYAFLIRKGISMDSIPITRI